MDNDRLVYIGHATVLLELGGVRLLTDPVLRNRLGHLRRQGQSPPAQVPDRIDVVLISHQHLDHLDPPSLKRLERDVPVVLPRGAGELVRRLGFREVVELEPGESTAIGGVDLTATRAVHDGRRRPFGPPAEAIGFDIRAGRRVYFAGDTDVFPEMADLAGGLDVALLPVWGWGPRLGPGHLDPNGAARAAALLKPRVVVPIHWGTFFPFGLARRHPEKLREPPRQLAAELASLAPEIEVRVVEPGGSLDL